MMKRKKQSKEKSKRYYLDQDDSCHWYLIPVSCKAKFEKFCSTGFEELPKGIVPINNHPHFVTFENPKNELY